MAVISLSNAQLAFGHVALLDHAEFSLELGERVGLIGRNGTGKSSLLRIIASQKNLDDGLLVIQQNLKIAYVEQEPQFDANQSIFDTVAQGVAEEIQLLKDYEATVEALNHEHTDALLEQLSHLQNQLEAKHAWNIQNQVNITLDKLNLPPELLIGSLSGGTKKRVALACALVGSPDVLILDEPTNHLDFSSIAWLENLLKEFKGSILFITHDRRFLDNVSTRIIELDRGIITSFPGNFSAYQQRKEEMLEMEEVENAKFDKLLAQEEVWIRKGVKARRCRDEGRVKRLENLRLIRSQRREQQGQVKLDVSTGERSGKIVAELENIHKSFGQKNIVNHFSSIILRGDKIGLIGNNGVGKTTLLKLILGEEKPDSGTIKQGSKLQIAYFDQMRAQLNEEASLADTISPGSDFVEINGQRKHIMSYLSDFLFSPERARSPVKSLSGGERNRLLLARLFAKPANVLVLDEPTNDLDIDTLELLEALLEEYSGTVFLVSHDREFLDNVVTQVIAYEGENNNGEWKEYIGGYSDWEAYQKSQFAKAAKLEANKKNEAKQESKVEEKSTLSEKNAEKTPENLVGKTSDTQTSKAKKLSYKEQRELEELPSKIEALEAEQKNISEKLADGDFYKNTATDEIKRMNERFEEIDSLLLQALERWDALS